MRPAEWELQVATNAAAKKAYDTARGDQEPEFERLPLQTQNAWRSAVLQIVNVALEALPDRLDPVRTLVAHAEENLESYVALKPLQAALR